MLQVICSIKNLTTLMIIRVVRFFYATSACDQKLAIARFLRHQVMTAISIGMRNTFSYEYVTIFLAYA